MKRRIANRARIARVRQTKHFNLGWILQRLEIRRSLGSGAVVCDDELPVLEGLAENRSDRGPQEVQAVEGRYDYRQGWARHALHSQTQHPRILQLDDSLPQIKLPGPVVPA